jgi:hypothetical protein
MRALSRFWICTSDLGGVLPRPAGSGWFPAWGPEFCHVPLQLAIARTMRHSGKEVKDHLKRKISPWRLGRHSALPSHDLCPAVPDQRVQSRAGTYKHGKGQHRAGGEGRVQPLRDSGTCCRSG